MAVFDLGEKASKEEAEKGLRKHAAKIWEGRFDVKFASDDGGNHIVLYLEVDDTSEMLESSITKALWFPKWMGWRYILLKCPEGYIDYILNSAVSDDW
jgi:hypothetical protein